MNSSAKLPLDIDVFGVQALLDAGADLLLLDCRTAEECALAAIQGSTHIPMAQLEQRGTELEPYRDRHIVVHCHLGGRSLRVTQWLRDRGYQKVQNMAGGIDAWAEQIDPSLPRY